MIHDYYRREYIRSEFDDLGEVKRFVPSHVHMMALTAIAMQCTITRVSAILGLIAPKVITTPPDKQNICYWVKPRGNLKDLLAPLLARLRQERVRMP